MDLYMIRHGESLANFTDTHAGWAPVPLTEKGEAQAEAARRHVRNLTFDRLYVSDVRRAQQTADILFPGVPRTFNTIIREINNTSMRGKTCDDMTALYGERYLACRKNFDYAPLGIDCESGAHMRAAFAVDAQRGVVEIFTAGEVAFAVQGGHVVAGLSAHRGVVDFADDGVERARNAGEQNVRRLLRAAHVAHVQAIERQVPHVSARGFGLRFALFRERHGRPARVRVGEIRQTFAVTDHIQIHTLPPDDRFLPFYRVFAPGKSMRA